MGVRGTARLAAEFWAFLRANKRWWLAPIIVGMLVLSLFVLATQSPLGPLIYTLF